MSFDRLARHYRWMEFVTAGNTLQRCRTAFLDRVGHCQNVLSVGEGNGRFLRECCRRLPGARLTCVDASGRMLALAREQLERQGEQPERVRFIQADALAWAPPAQAFDLLVTHFFLDCFRPEQLERVLARLAGAATAEAAWLVADFRVPPAGLARWRAQWIHRLMYAFFRVATRLPAERLTEPDALLRAHGFALRERRTSEWGLLHTDWWVRGASTPETHEEPRRQVEQHSIQRICRQRKAE